MACCTRVPIKVKQNGALDVSITLNWNFILHFIDIKNDLEKQGNRRNNIA